MSNKQHPAQDEREAVERFSPTTSVPHCGRASEVEAYMTEDDDGEYMTVSQHERIVAALTRPAQTEQQPVEQWQVRYLPGQKVEERWWQDSTAERAAWCAEANAEQLAKGLPDVWEIRKFYAAPIAQTEQQPYAWATEREGDPTFPRLHKDEHQADHWVQVCNVAPPIIKRPLYAAPIAQPAPLKPHQLRELVNDLRDVARKYHATEQLREQIAYTLRTALSTQGGETK